MTIITFETYELPKSYVPESNNIYWEFVCCHYLQSNLWEKIYKKKLCRNSPNGWIYSFKALLFLIEEGYILNVDGIKCQYKSKLADHILSLAHSEHFEKLKTEYLFEIERKRKENDWDRLTPRFYDPKEICRLIGEVPIKIKKGFCGMCDSHIYNSWCSANGDEIWHLTHLSPGILRPSEYKILIESLENGDLNGFSIKDEKSIFRKILYWVFNT